MKYDLNELIERCQQREMAAQKELYDGYKSVLMGICRRYLRTAEDAEDVLVESFVRIFTKIDDFKGQGSFEGWMKKITVNEALMYLRKNKIQFQELNIISEGLSEEPDYDEKMEEQDIISLMDQLPPGYRAVLNLYDVEGYKHREIADILGISINTSKSQLILARKKMKELISKKLNVS